MASFGSRNHSGGKSHQEIDFPPGTSHHTCAGHLVCLGAPKSHVVHIAAHNPTELKHELAGAVLPVGDHHVAISCDDTTLKHLSTTHFLSLHL